MTLKPTDMLEIQSAIDAYERKFPGRRAPSAAVALEWRLGKREWSRRLLRNPELAPEIEREPDQMLARQECNRLVWVWQQFRLHRQISDHAEEDVAAWMRKLLVVGWWGAMAVVVASVFFFGALVGGFK